MKALLQRLGLPTPVPALELIEWHQAAAHFPVALLMTSLVFALCAAAFKKGSLRDAAYWSHIAGTAAGIVTFALGWWGNPYAGHGGASAERAEFHKWWALASLVLFFVLALWRVTRRDVFSRRQYWAFHCLYFAGFALIGITGYLGGHIAK